MDIVDDKENSFPLSELLETEYFKKYKNGYYRCRDEGCQIGERNYINLLTYLTEIYEYNEQHARGFAKSLRSEKSEWNNCEAIFAEIIVYRYYVRLAYEGLIKSILRHTDECDIIIERNDGSLTYLEVFCVMPNLKQPEKSGEVIVQDIKTHTQEEMASIRQKLLQKIKKQKQLTKPRENYAVIELNHPSISGEFSILSSLSGGYKIKFNKKTMKQMSSGYDWSDSVFNDESTRNLKGIIYFSLGDYASRRYIFNPLFGNK